MANVKFTAKEEAFVAAMYKASGAVGVLAAKINVDLVRSYQQADAVQRVLNKGIVRFGEEAMATGQKLTFGLTAPILAIGAAGVKSFAEVEALMMGLEVVDGSSQKAAASFERIKAIAKQPGLGFMEAAQGYTNLRAVGFSAEFAEKALKNLGNALAISGKGKFEFGSILTQLTQMSSKSAVLAEDLKPILNSAPVIAKLLKEMYGSVDSEAISNALKAQGKGPQDFINELITALDGVKKVSGGAKNALENFGDSMLIAGSNIGGVINKSTGLTNAIDGIGNAVVELSEWFKDLSPEMQNFIVVGAGLGAVAGPLLYGVGSLTTMLPGLITQMTLARLATGGWAIAALGLVTAIGTAIIENERFNKITQSVEATHRDAAKSIAQETNAVTKNLQIVREGIGTTEQIKKAKADLSALSPAFRDSLKGETIDFIKLNTAASKYITTLKNVSDAKFAQKQKEDLLVAAEELRSGKGVTFIDRIKAKKYTGDVENDPDKQARYEKSVKIFETIKKLDKEIERAVKESGMTYEEIFGENEKKTSTAIVKNAEGKKEAIKKAFKFDFMPDQLNNDDLQDLLEGFYSPEQATKDYKDNFSEQAWDRYLGAVNESILKSLENNDTLKNGSVLNLDLSDDKKSLNDARNLLEDYDREINNNPNYDNRNIDALKLPSGYLNMSLVDTQKLLAEKLAMKDIFNGMIDDLEQFQKMAGYLLKEGMLDSFGSFFENMASGNGFGGSFKGAMGGLMTTLGGLLMDFGKKALMAEKAIQAIKLSFGSGPWAALGAIAIGGVIKGYGSTLKAPKFAQGGMVTGPMLAMVGDNNSGKEAIIPFEKMGTFLGKYGGGGDTPFVISHKITGAELDLIITRHKKTV